MFKGSELDTFQHQNKNQDKKGITVNTMTQSAKLLYTAKAHTTGGRDGGVSRTSDGRLDLKFSIPGGPGAGTNPEQLFAAGWSACFLVLLCYNSACLWQRIIVYFCSARCCEARSNQPNIKDWKGADDDSPK